MIEWIKFKGSTEEDRWNELTLPCNILNPDEKFGYVLFEDAVPTDFKFMDFEVWAPLNLPQEEKWERIVNLNDYEGLHLRDALSEEFDNIYSILNELRKR